MVSVCGFSALSNHLIYRNPPFHRIAQTVVRYAESPTRQDAAIGVPAVHYQNPAQDANIAWAFSRVPIEMRGNRGYYVWTALESEIQIASWLRRTGQNRQLRTIVLTDRYADERSPGDALSDESAARLLGPSWKLMYTETYEWHYEWRFYIFHTWRTRVWQQTPQTGFRIPFLGGG